MKHGRESRRFKAHPLWRELQYDAIRTHWLRIWNRPSAPVRINSIPTLPPPECHSHNDVERFPVLFYLWQERGWSRTASHHKAPDQAPRWLRRPSPASTSNKNILEELIVVRARSGFLMTTTLGIPAGSKFLGIAHQRQLSVVGAVELFVENGAHHQPGAYPSEPTDPYAV